MTALALVKDVAFDDDAVDLGGTPRARAHSAAVEDFAYCPDSPQQPQASFTGPANPMSPRGRGGRGGATANPIHAADV